MPFSEIFFHSAVGLWNNLWLILLPLSFVLAWQDFQKLMVNRNLAYLTGAVFSLGFAHANNISITICLITFAVLMIYQKFRPLSIQKVDIEFFALSILWLNPNIIPIYSFLVALFLVLFKVLLKQAKLPFLTAWFIGFWVIFIFEKI